MMKKILHLDHYAQTTDYTCGPATLLTFLNYHDKKLSNRYTEKKLVNVLKTCPKIGTSSHSLYQCLQQTGKKFNLSHRAHLKDLEMNIDDEHPSIVLWFNVDEWHWSTVVGYDPHHIILLDPYLQEGLNLIEKQNFISHWSKLSIK